MHNKNPCKLQTNVDFHNLVKCIYKTPTENVSWNQGREKNAHFINLIQDYIEGSSQYHIINAIM